MDQDFRLLLHGIDTVQCSYFLQGTERASLDFQKLTIQKESIRQSKRKHPVPVKFGNTEFLLQPYGTQSGYTFVIENNDFKIEISEYISPNFYVTFRSGALWRESAFVLHSKFLSWASSIGYEPVRSEKLSRVDLTFDYNHKCPKVTAIDSIGYRHQWYQFRNSVQKAPAKWAFSRMWSHSKFVELCKGFGPVSIAS